MARKTNHRKGKGKKVYSIIVDGETEVWYFQMMKRHEKLLNRVDIKPELPKKKRFSEQFKLIKENAKIYDEVIWLIDFDTIIKEEQELTRNIFGEYVSVYDFKRAIEDEATLPLRYLNRGEKLNIDNPELDERMAEAFENEDLDDDQKKKLEYLFGILQD